MRPLRRGVLGLLVSVAAVAASAQDPQAPQSKGFADAAVSADLVKTGLYLITGGGSNSLLRLSASGSILVDGKLPGNYRGLMAQVRRISKLSDLPIRVLILTDHHENHAGTIAEFAAAHVPVLAQVNVVGHLFDDKPSGAKVAIPSITYDRDYTLRLGGVEARLEHFGNAHTSGDTVVYFADLKVVAVGDLYTPDTPEPDFAGGGSLVNWGPVLAQVLKLDFDIVVPSVGPMVTRSALAMFKSKLDTLISRASALVGKGVAKDELMAQLGTDDLGWRFGFSADQLDRFYAELAQQR